MSLAELDIGKEVKIVALNVNKDTKNRFDGLGIIKDSKIKTLRKSFGIKLYKIKDSYIALRNEDASKIHVI